MRPARKPNHRSRSGPAIPYRAAGPGPSPGQGQGAPLTEQGLELSQTHQSSDIAWARSEDFLAEVKRSSRAHRCMRNSSCLTSPWSEPCHSWSLLLGKSGTVESQCPGASPVPTLLAWPHSSSTWGWEPVPMARAVPNAPFYSECWL